MEDIVELGTDISSTWEFIKGDLVLVNHTDNMRQAIKNRLSCPLDYLDYDNYGSDIHSFLGGRKNDTVLDFLKIEIETRLIQDPRIQDFEVTTYIKEDENVGIDIDVNFDEDMDLSMSLVLNNEGVIEDE
ncbi:MAG: hypothetical protein IKF11_04465 [Methanobrevibacter sp.]|nr:hypothetical protein [Methanobrevibacter sp.]